MRPPGTQLSISSTYQTFPCMLTSRRRLLLPCSSQVPVMAEAGPELSLSASNCTRVAATHASDFIWAVRLAKITNNGPQATWTVETVFNRDSLLGRKATFTRGSDPADAAAFDPKPEIAGEGLSESEFEVTTVTTPGRRGEEQVHFITISDEDEERMIKSVMREVSEYYY